jgi:hypothetical protein
MINNKKDRKMYRSYYRFRGRVLNGNEWVYGSLVDSEERSWIVQTGCGNETRMTEVEPRSVGFATGYYDKNGREIYENDILLLENGRKMRVRLLPKGMELFAQYLDTRQMVTLLDIYVNFVNTRARVVGNVLKNSGSADFYFDISIPDSVLKEAAPGWDRFEESGAPSEEDARKDAEGGA